MLSINNYKEHPSWQQTTGQKNYCPQGQQALHFSFRAFEQTKTNCSTVERKVGSALGGEEGEGVG